MLYHIWHMPYEILFLAAHSNVIGLTNFNLMTALLSSLTSLPLVRRTPATIDPPNTANPPTAAPVGMLLPLEDAIPESIAIVTPAPPISAPLTTLSTTLPPSAPALSVPSGSDFTFSSRVKSEADFITTA